MANTYKQFYAHLVFAVKNRESLIKKSIKNELEKYISGIIQNHNHKLIAINCMPDHIHIFFGYNLNELIPDLVEEIKTSTNKWINTNNFTGFRFEWQKGYGAFSHSHSQISTVANYIENQENHHIRNTFKQEYLDILRKNEIKFQDEYLFDFFE